MATPRIPYKAKLVHGTSKGIPNLCSVETGLPVPALGVIYYHKPALSLSDIEAFQAGNTEYVKLLTYAECAVCSSVIMVSQDPLWSCITCHIVVCLECGSDSIGRDARGMQSVCCLECEPERYIYASR